MPCGCRCHQKNCYLSPLCLCHRPESPGWDKSALSSPVTSPSSCCRSSFNSFFLAVQRVLSSLCFRVNRDLKGSCLSSSPGRASAVVCPFKRELKAVSDSGCRALLTWEVAAALPIGQPAPKAPSSEVQEDALVGCRGSLSSWPLHQRWQGRGEAGARGSLQCGAQEALAGGCCQQPRSHEEGALCHVASGAQRSLQLTGALTCVHRHPLPMMHKSTLLLITRGSH